MTTSGYKRQYDVHLQRRGTRHWRCLWWDFQAVIQDTTNQPKGIGRETALSFAREGCKRLVLVDRDAHKLRETENAIASLSKDQAFQAISVPTDISKANEIESLYNTTIDKFGRIDYVVNAAGSFQESNFLSQALTAAQAY
jgi:NAD(P)-dependent dehydrogenase (short-subunit alcohol dehydrogenase family)